MTRFVFVLLLTGAVWNAHAQVLTPVKWHFSAVPVGKSEVHLIFTASLDEGWHIYSQSIGEDGPLPTTFTFSPSTDYTPMGKVEEMGTPVKSFDKTFMMDIIWFAKTAVFRQKIKLHEQATTIKGKIEFMVCTDEMCLPPDVIEFAIEAKADKPESRKTELHKEKRTTKKDSLKQSVSIKVESTPLDEAVNTTPATWDAMGVITKDSDTINSTLNANEILSTQEINEQAKTESSLWGVFVAGLLGGLAALLMPCIFPMIPFTVSFFTKTTRSKTIRNALLYGLSIVVLYVGLGLLITILFGSDALNRFSTNGIFNFFIFLLLVAFAASLLGAFEIRLPSAWITKVDAEADRNDGWLRIFFMAATLSLVSFSCTAPIIGTLLVEATTQKNYLAPAIGMLGFSLALALPFTLFALFPSWLKALPKSGSWLNDIKVVLGFLELALALKFLSNVDLAYHWEWFDREVFLVLWIIIFALLGFFLLGKINFSLEEETRPISTSRLFLSIITLAFTLYMIPGLWGAPLKVISAFLPPAHTQDFDLYSNNLENKGLITSVNHTMKKYDDLFHAPYNINAFFDYDEGMAYAKKINKPVFLDFTGHACVNCRKMETTVWSDPRVLNRLKNDFVVIQLYVDDKTELPLREQFFSDHTDRPVLTLGNKWSDFQATVFGTNSQPWYVQLDNDGRILTPPRGADYNVENFANFLDEGLNGFNKQ